MKKYTFLLALVATVFSANAFAQVAQCPDADTDSFAVCSASCVLPAGIKCGDCDDVHSNINPGATELWDNGLNDDCKNEAWENSSGDRVSLGSVVLARFSNGLGRSIAPKSAQELRLLKDIMACKGSSDCTVDYVGGKLKASTGFLLVDTDCDGVINVVSETYSPTLADQKKCSKAASVAPKAPAVRRVVPAVTLPGTATPTTAPAAPVKGARGAVIDWSTPIAKAQATADEAKKMATEVSATVGILDATVKGHGEKLSVLDAALAETNAAIEAETARATAAEGEIDTKAQAAIDRSTEAVATAEEAKKLAEEAEKKGVLVELSMGGATLFQHDARVREGEGEGANVYKMRGDYSLGGYAGLNVGYANESGRYLGFFNLLPIADKGRNGWESGIAYQAGAEATLKSLGGLGAHVMFLQHDAGGSVVGANTYSRGGGLGLSYATTTSGSNFKVGFQARGTVGIEDYGAGKESSSDFFAALSAGINFGFGPK